MLIMLLVILVMLAGCVPAQNTNESGAGPFFDGATFAGWEGNREFFRIEDGAIVGGRLDREIPRNEFLCTTAEYDDFELSFQVKIIDQRTNAGVQFHTQRIPDNHEVIGYQADIGVGYWGVIYDESRRNRIIAPTADSLIERILKPDDWNDYVVRTQGDRTQIFINDEQTVDYTESEQHIPESGLICLQIHSGPPGEVWYRNLMLTSFTE